MKITALLLLNCGAASKDDANVLANASDVSHFGYFQRASAKEFILFVARTIAKRTPAGQRQSVEQEEYMVHAYNRNGLCGVAFVDAQYPMRSAFSVLTKVLDEYQQVFGNSWQSVQSDSSNVWPYINDALTKYQDPTEADKLLKIQRELDETKHILVQLHYCNVYCSVLNGIDEAFVTTHHMSLQHKTIDSVLERGEKLDSLVEKSTDLSMASQVFYKQAKRTNQCCTIL